jgi:hypothetical protein
MVPSMPFYLPLLLLIIAALTREHDGWEQACLRTYGERSRVKCLVLARPARLDKVLDEVSAVNGCFTRGGFLPSQ